MQWLRDRREELRLTLDDVAERLQLEGVSYTAASVGHWETGRRKMPLKDSEFVNALAIVLKMDAATVLRMSGLPVQSHFSDEAERIAALVDKLTGKDRRRVLKIVEAFLDD